MEFLFIVGCDVLREIIKIRGRELGRRERLKERERESVCDLRFVVIIVIDIKILVY